MKGKDFVFMKRNPSAANIPRPRKNHLSGGAKEFSFISSEGEESGTNYMMNTLSHTVTGNPLLDQTQGSRNMSAEPTRWVPNEKSKCCLICSKRFKLFRRKHHCRACGILVCAACSDEKDYVPGFKDRKVRVCKYCFSSKMRRKQEISMKHVFTSVA